MLPLRSMQALANQESRRCHRRSPYDKSRGRHNGLHIGGEFTKAGKGIRTRDIQLGKLTLYQLSYTREGAECSGNEREMTCERAIGFVGGW